jgi:hypothetical protein
MAIQNLTLTTGAAANILVGSGQLGTATTTVYLCNNSPTTIGVNVFAVMAGFVANANNQIYSNKLVASNDTYIMDVEKIFLGPGDTLRANCNVTSGLNVTVSSIGL